MTNKNNGYCECGCGNKTPIAKRTRPEKGHIKGEPTKYCVGHSHLSKPGKESPLWKGGKSLSSHGYITKSMGRNKKIYEHTTIAEKALGKQMPPTACIHHIDGNRTNNKNNNLIICESTKYHFLLHRRKRAYDACGHASWLKCWVCQKWDDPKNLRQYGSNNRPHHRKCRIERNRQNRVQRNG